MATIRTHYLDASALVKLVVKEDGSDRLNKYRESHSNFRTTFVCLVESLGVLKVKRFYRNEIGEEEYFAGCDLLTRQVSSGEIEIENTDLGGRTIFHEVEQLCKKYSVDLSDGLQIYTLKKGFFSVLPGDSAPILLTADDALADAVEAEGYRAWNFLKEIEPKVRY
jgi:predicted nucleic acid-binding protein